MAKLAPADGEGYRYLNRIGVWILLNLLGYRTEFRGYEIAERPLPNLNNWAHRITDPTQILDVEVPGLHSSNGAQLVPRTHLVSCEFVATMQAHMCTSLFAGNVIDHCPGVSEDVDEFYTQVLSEHKAGGEGWRATLKAELQAFVERYDGKYPPTRWTSNKFGWRARGGTRAPSARA